MAGWQHIWLQIWFAMLDNLILQNSTASCITALKMEQLYMRIGLWQTHLRTRRRQLLYDQHGHDDRTVKGNQYLPKCTFVCNQAEGILCDALGDPELRAAFSQDHSQNVTWQDRGRL
ncbi:TPA: hypothetical protein ACH3X3_15270 [Trebouxia sp. C0006]